MPQEPTAARGVDLSVTRTLLAALLLLARPGAALAQGGLDDLVHSDPFSNDPIGVDAQSDLHRIPVPRASGTPTVDLTRGPTPPSVEPIAGAALVAIPAIREVDHEVTVRLEEGLAYGETRMRFVSRSRLRAEVQYRLAMPEGAELASLTVCAGEACTTGVPRAASGALSPYDDAVRARPTDASGARAPIGSARAVRDAKGHAFLVRAAPIAPEGGELRVTVGWVARAPVRGGVARLVIPARGQDPRAAPAVVRVTATDLLNPAAEGSASAVELDPWIDAQITAHAPTGAPLVASATSFSCEGRRCARLRVVAGPRRGAPVDLVVLVDASPSMEGPARGRVGAAVATLLASAPPGSRVRAAAFGARAEAIIEDPVAVEDAPLLPFARAAMMELGASTRFESAWPLAKRWLVRQREATLEPLVVLVGDGNVAASAAFDSAAVEARRARVRVAVVNLADRETTGALEALARATGGVTVAAANEADLASRGRDAARLEEVLAPIFAPKAASDVVVRLDGRRISLGPLRAGEEIVWIGSLGRARVASIGAGIARARTRLARDDTASALAGFVPGAAETELLALSAAAPPVPPDQRCDPRGPGRLAGGVNDDLRPIAFASRRACGNSTAAERAPSEGRGVPANTVLTMLRQRVVPVARQCFRRDRAGRADYSVRATFVFRLGDREVLDARLDGEIDPLLRQCLLEAVHDLDVPRFTGVVLVRYPLYTEREQRPPVIELEPEVAREVDRILQ